MGEVRRPSDTLPMSREAIDRALEERHDTLPLPVQAAIAEAQQLDAVLCPACKCGLVSAEVAERVAAAIEGEEAPVTAVDEIITQPVKS